MTKIEALKLELAAREMVEGTGIKWKDVIRLKETKQCFYPAWARDHSMDEFELALGLVEGKPVWGGDTIYDSCGRAEKASAYWDFKRGYPWSWNPPKPKTVMIKLTVEQAELGAKLELTTDIASACRKALKEMK